MEFGSIAVIEAGPPVAGAGEEPGQGRDLRSEQRYGPGQLDPVLIRRIAGLHRYL